MSVGWIKERKHGLSNEDGLLLLTLLWKCAMAPPDFTSHEVDHKYQEAVKVLKRTENFKKNEQVPAAVATIKMAVNTTGMNNIVLCYYIHNSDGLKLIQQQSIMQQ